MNPKAGMGAGAEPAENLEMKMGKDGIGVVRGEHRPAYMNRCQYMMQSGRFLNRARPQHLTCRDVSR